MKDLRFVPEISIIVINYNGKNYLDKMFESLARQTFKNFEVIFLDNNSTDGSINFLKKNIIVQKKFKKNFTLIESKRNTGFAEGNNIAVKSAKGKYIFFLNTDVILERDVLEKLYLLIDKHPFVAGVAPKTYLSRFFPLKIFDSVGICMDPNGSPYNRGIGQLDFGQYDEEKEIMGVCFSACLVRKNIFLNLRGLDKTYFAYFEDVDWCFRARKNGYKFIFKPEAIVHHYHSGSSSSFSYEWKYRLIFQNYLRTAIKDFGKKNAIRIICLKTKDLIKCFFKKDSSTGFKKVILKILLQFWMKDIFLYSLRRFNTKKDFIPEITDESIFEFCYMEPSSFFDPKKYQPKISIKMLDFIIYKKNYLSPDSKMIKEWETLKEILYCLPSKDIWKKKFVKFARNKLDAKLTNKQLDLILQYIYSDLLYEE